MTVYVESNFVLEQSLEQEECESCAAIMQLASNGRIDLAVPAFSLAEPHAAIRGKEKARGRLSNELRSQLYEIGRSRPHREVPATFSTLASLLIERVQFEQQGLRGTISALLQTAQVIALDAAILRSAATAQTDYRMSNQDAIVLASVLAHLDLHHPADSCFLNRDSKDFDDPDIRDSLEQRGCKFFSSFSQGLHYVRTRIGAI